LLEDHAAIAVIAGELCGLIRVHLELPDLEFFGGNRAKRAMSAISSRSRDAPACQMTLEPKGQQARDEWVNQSRPRKQGTRIFWLRS